MFEDSPLALDKWMETVWLIVFFIKQKTAYEIQRALGITQKSSWFMLPRIRLAMNSGSFEKMQGSVEVDETYIGGRAANMHKSRREKLGKMQGGQGKSIVMGLLERHGKVKARI